MRGSTAKKQTPADTLGVSSAEPTTPLIAA